jgi:hypothetical protein
VEKERKKEAWVIYAKKKIKSPRTPDLGFYKCIASNEHFHVGTKKLFLSAVTLVLKLPSLMDQ